MSIVPNKDTATVTSKVGPGLDITAIVFHHVRDIDFNLEAQTVRIVADETPTGGQYFDLYGTTTVTYVIATHIATVTISQ